MSYWIFPVCFYLWNSFFTINFRKVQRDIENAYCNFKMFIKIKIKYQKEIINHFIMDKMIIFV